MAALEPELQKVHAALSALKAAEAKSDAEKRAERAVEEMKARIPGIRGRLIDLLEPKARRYATATAVALGRHADAVVCTSQEDALAGIR
jgi:structural maintenance of chromosome 1